MKRAALLVKEGKGKNEIRTGTITKWYKATRRINPMKKCSGMKLGLSALSIKGSHSSALVAPLLFSLFVVTFAISWKLIFVF